MKEICEIPECNKILDEMFAEWDKLAPLKHNVTHSWKRDKEFKEIEKKYLPKVFEAYDKYKQEHPEEFKDEK